MNKALTEATTPAPYIPASVPSARAPRTDARSTSYSRPVFGLMPTRRANNPVRLDQVAAGWRGLVSGRIGAQYRLTGGYRLLILHTPEGAVFWAVLNHTQSRAYTWLPGLRVTFLGRKRLPDEDCPNTPTTFDVLDIQAVTR